MSQQNARSSLRRSTASRLGAGVVLAALALGAAAAPVQAAPSPVTAGNGMVTPSDRVAGLVAQMTLDEKLTFVSSKPDPNTRGQAGYIPGVPRLGIPELRMADGPAGIRANAPATALPAPTLLASTFDEDMAYKYGQIMGRDGRALGQDVLLSPMTNIIRVPQAGRNFETFSEDPLVSSRIVSSQIEGIQSEGLIATIKHYAANNQETERQTINVTVDDQTLREVELPAFQAAIDAGVGSVMCAYNKVGGQYACGHEDLLDNILKEQWNFQGWVMSDWGATHASTDLVAGLDQNMFLARLGQPSTSTFFEEPLKQAILRGEIPMAELDDAVSRIVGQMEIFGLLDGADTDRPTRDSAASAAAAQEVAEAGAVLLRNENGSLPLGPEDTSIALIGSSAKSPKIGGGGSSSVVPDYAASPIDAITELAGDDVDITYTPGIDLAGVPLPLSDSPLAADGTLVVTPQQRLSYTRTIEVPEDGEYTFSVNAPGSFATVTIDGKLVVRNSYANTSASTQLTAGTHEIIITGSALQGVPQTLSFRWVTPEAVTAARLEAVEVARQVETPIVFANDVGLEGVDRPDLSLPFGQHQLISAVAEANPNTIVVLNAGSSVTMPWIDDVSAVLDMYYPGQNGAEATARLLYGEVNPSGKLTQTFPRSESETPVAGNPLAFPGVSGQQEYTEGLDVGYKWYDRNDVDPLFAFGHGLSYTDFAYGELELTADHDSLTVAFDLTNTGERAGSEVAQVYLGASPDLDLPQVEKKLVGFDKITLAPGETQRVTIEVDKEEMSSWDVDTDDWALGTGTREVFVGGSSDALELSGTADVGVTFSDVVKGDQFYKEITWLAERGISTGWVLPDGTREYRPLAPIARDAMAAFLYRAAGSPEFTEPVTSPFTDVSTSNQFYKEISWLAEEGISTGWDNGDGTASFRPLEPIARDAMAAFLHRSAGSPAVELPTASPFVDVSADNQFYAEIVWMQSTGIATGWQGNDGRDDYRPLSSVARDAMAAFLYRYDSTL